MGNDASYDKTAAQTGRIATNSRCAASATRDGIFIRLLASPDQRTCVPRTPTSSKSLQALALSPGLGERLAVSHDDRIHILDTGHARQTHAVPGAGRTVTSLAWSDHDDGLLASGAIDGAISLWSLDKPSRPLCQLPGLGTSCRALAFNPVRQNIIASAHGNNIAIWALERPCTPVQILSRGSAHVFYLTWHPIVLERLLAITSDNHVMVWDVLRAQIDEQTMLGEGVTGVDSMFGEMEGLQQSVHPIADVPYRDPIKAARWLGEHGMAVLAAAGSTVLCCSFGADWEMLHEVWRLKLQESAETIIIYQEAGAMTIAAVSDSTIESYRVPSAITDSVGGAVLPQPLSLMHDIKDFGESTSGRDARRRVLPVSFAPYISMSPAPIKTALDKRRSFARTSKQLQQRRGWSGRNHTQAAATIPTESVASHVAASSRGMTSSLELPKLRGEDDESPMPFLSPTIPARKPSPNTLLPPVENSLMLPLLRYTSLDSTHGTVQDSDSDDETFTNCMRGSSTLLPGGINVPLPRTCGAAFGLNGQLTTFFPSRPRRQSTPNDHAQHHSAQVSQAKKIATLFPTFGNLLCDDSAVDVGSGPRSSGSSDHGLMRDMHVLNTHLPTYHAGQSWDEQVAPLEIASGSVEYKHKVHVSVHSVASLLTSSPDSLAEYRIFRGEVEEGSDVCRHNAKVAATIGSQEVADVWRLVAMLLDDEIPLALLNAHEAPEDDVAVVARRVLASRSNADHPHEIEGIPKLEHDECALFGKYRWADNPFGRLWLVRNALLWAEQKADTQMLAYLSAVLAESDITDLSQHAMSPPSIFTELPTFGLPYVHSADGAIDAIEDAKQTPMVQREAQPAYAAYRPPMSIRQNSKASSLAPSHPHTLVPDSGTTTPLTFGAISRQNARLPTTGSGSASPEHHRSSFSAAARHYAQSISDKIAGYGTSPPIKKLGSSPGGTELSSSLPTGGGSWSKSVSFASTAGTANNSQLSKSYTENDGLYDSDRTIDDNSQPHTPKTPTDEVAVTFPNDQLFSDNVSGTANLPLLPPDLAFSASIWRKYHAGQLRCAGYWMRAAELEKITGLTDPAELHDVWDDGVVPARALEQGKATCSICMSIITKLQQLCPKCLHTTHLPCLEQYLVSLNTEAYECPTGCGCLCTDLSSSVMQLDMSEISALDDDDQTD